MTHEQPRALLRVASMPLERYVAHVVATESDAGTPPEALRALAVVVRTYALAAADSWRHADAALCNLTHCQAMNGAVRGERLAAARQAAEATRGEVLRLADGSLAVPLFHASCGGHTADPAELFGGEDRSGARAVEDAGCKSNWRALLTRRQFSSAYEVAFGVPPGPALKAERLRLARGAGGFVIHVADRSAARGEDGPRRCLGDRLARALDATMRYGAVRSSRMRFIDLPEGVAIEGSGIGHGAGLCQAGAARRAGRGEEHEMILAHYFPRAKLSTL